MKMTNETNVILFILGLNSVGNVWVYLQQIKTIFRVETVATAVFRFHQLCSVSKNPKSIEIIRML